MSDAAQAGFDERDNWALRMQHRYALAVYKEYWAVSLNDITEVDECRKTEKAAEVLDTDGGTDKVVTPATGIRHVAQRFRTRSYNEEYDHVFDPDFSIRTSSYSDKDTEYDKVLNAWRNDGNVPAVYAFGVGDGTSREECLQKGFREFYFIDYPAFLRQFDNNRLTADAQHGNGDGSEALYFRTETLESAGVIRDAISGQVLSSAWKDQQTSDEFPTAPGIKKTGQVELFDFGGD